MSDWQPTASELRALKLLLKRSAHEFTHAPLPILEALRSKGWVYSTPYETLWHGERVQSLETRITDAGRGILEHFS